VNVPLPLSGVQVSACATNDTTIKANTDIDTGFMLPSAGDCECRAF
jgi:hypothetical protein